MAHLHVLLVADVELGPQRQPALDRCDDGVLQPAEERAVACPDAVCDAAAVGPNNR